MLALRFPNALWICKIYNQGCTELSEDHTEVVFEIQYILQN